MHLREQGIGRRTDAEFQIEQDLLAPNTAAETRQGAIGPDHAMAGNDNRQRILPAGFANRPAGRRCLPDISRNLAVGGGLAIGDFQHPPPHRELEFVAARFQRKVEIGALAGEIIPDLACRIGKFGIVALPFGHWFAGTATARKADDKQLVSGSGEEQRPDRAVDFGEFHLRFHHGRNIGPNPKDCHPKTPKMDVMETIEQLTGRFPRTGKVEWIGIRPARAQPVASVARVAARRGGLEGDHREKEGLRAVTLIQHEHLAAIAALAGLAKVDPAMLRRNIAISGINLLALKGRTFRIGTALLNGTDICAPCSRMEAALGLGGYNAMRGHGGLCAAVVEEGEITVGGEVVAQ